MSDPVYAQRGVAWRDSFTYLTPEGVLTTGLVQSDFTLRLSKNGVGNQSTTGITVTEVSAANNPGEYAVYVPPTAFVAADGVYQLTVTRTSDPRFTFTQSVIVNVSGSQASSGVVFTPAASNGRVVEAGSPLQGATVAVSLAGVVYAVFTTDASGLWGPIYLGTDGIYTLTVQKVGYTATTATLTISGGGTVATGPGADIAIVAASDNPLSAANLWAYFTRQARDVAGAKANVERMQGVQDALDKVAKEGLWSWLLRRSYLAFNASQTLTVTLTNGSATATTAGTFPTWAASGRILAESRVFDIFTRDSATQITLDAAWSGATGSYSTVVFQDEYALPDALLRFHQLIPGPRWGWGGAPLAPEEFYQRQCAMVLGMQFPSGYTIQSGKLMVYPYPTESNTVAFTYYARPALLTNSADIADWDPAQIDVLRRAIDVQVAVRYGSYAGGDHATAMRHYKEALALLASTDRSPTAVEGALDSVDPFDLRNDRAAWTRSGGY